MNTLKPSNRLAWIDYARGIAIILVLYRHIFEGISRSGVEAQQFSYLEHANIIFYSFRMPLFFILSGVFIGKSLAKRGMQRLIANKASILLYPYLVWSVIQITLQIALGGIVNANRGLVDYGYIFILPRRIDQFWYLYALFNVSVLYIVTKEKLKFKVWHQLAIGFTFWCISTYIATHEILLGPIYDVIHFYFFFAIGELIADQILDTRNHAFYSSWKLFFCLLPFFAVAQYYFLITNLQMQDNAFVEEHQAMLFIVIALIGCAFMINVSFLLQRYDVLKPLRIAGFHSLYIYVSHVLIASAVRMCLVKVFHITYLPVLLVICLCFAVVVPILLYKAAMRAGAWWLYSLEKPMELKLS